MANGLLPPFVTKFKKELDQFAQRRPGVPLESLEYATEEKDYPLDKERKNELIHSRSGVGIFITTATGTAYVRPNKITGRIYKLRVGGISLPFQKLFLSNAAQPGKQVSIIIGYEGFIEFTNPATEDTQSSLLARFQSDVATGQRVYVGALASQIVAANPLRVGFVIQNVGDYDLYWGYTAGVTIDSGQILEAGAMLEDWRYKGAIYGITEAGTTDVRKSEFT